MEQFKIKKDGFKEIRKEMMIKLIPILLLMAFSLLAFSYFNTEEQERSLSFLSLSTLILLSVMAIGLYKGINKRKEICESYTLTFDDNGITGEQVNTASISISNTDISEIIKNPNGSFTIKGNSPTIFIGVPSQIEDYEKLEKLLAEIKPISINNSSSFIRKFRGVIFLVTIFLMPAILFSNNHMVVGISGIFLLIVSGYSLFEIKKNKNTDSKYKKEMWWLIELILVIVGLMYYKIIGIEF